MKPAIFKILLFLGLVFTFSGFKRSGNSEIPLRLIVIEGSDWCANCRRLEKDVLGKGDFIQFLNQHNIALQKVDFPQRKKLSPEQKKYNDSIAEKYAFDGAYPAIFLSRTDAFVYEKLVYNNQNVNEMTLQIDQKLARLK